MFHVKPSLGILAVLDAERHVLWILSGWGFDIHRCGLVWNSLAIVSRLAMRAGGAVDGFGAMTPCFTWNRGLGTDLRRAHAHVA